MIVYVLWRLATVLLRAVPLRLSHACAALIGTLVFICWREKRSNTIDNIRHVLPEADDARVRRVAGDSWRNYAKYLVDFLRAADGRAGDLTGKVEFEGRPLVDDAFRHGKGVLLVLMHLGSWDIGGAFFSRLGYRLNVVVETFGNSRLNALVVAARTTSGMHVIPMEKPGLQIVRALRRNEALAILIDRPYADNGVPVQFFGGETVLPAGLARLALRTDARVVAAAVVRSGGPGSRMRAVVDASISAPRTGDDSTDVRALTEACLRAHERFIRQYPDQWYMFRRMWPAGAPAPRAAAPGQSDVDLTRTTRSVNSGPRLSPRLPNRLKYLLYRLAAAAVPRTPPPLVYALAAVGGTVTYFLTPGRRGAVQDNLRHVLGQEVSSRLIGRTGRGIYRSVARYYVDLLSAPRVDAVQLRRSRVQERGYEHLQAALAQGHGAILATIHYGCPEIALQAARAWGVEFLVLTEPIDPPELSKLFDRLRATHGHRFMPAGLRGAKEAIRTLRRGGAVLLAVDRDIQGHGIDVPLFGVATRMPTGAVELARRTGAPIIPAVSHRQRDGTALVSFDPPVELIESGERRSDISANVGRMLGRFEAFIRADPSQWLVLERLWEQREATPGSRGSSPAP